MTTPLSSPPASASQAPAPARVHLHRFSSRADGSVLALFTGSRADQEVAARAADLARAGRPVVAAAVVRSTGFSINAVLHHARARRVQAEADAILAAVLPVVARAGPTRTGSLVVPARVNPYRALPVGRAERAAVRAGADVVLSPVPLTGRTPPGARRLRDVQAPQDTPVPGRRVAPGRHEPAGRTAGRTAGHRSRSGRPGPAAAPGTPR
ncbi:hypothetical protein BU52_02135 [Streptomyces toyocaensis]|uniref:Uncharacterized protein n=1 Tax=Streptomyces toyocaensis TaxID=55952 RepID=A0A081XZA0_STRTO|nr:hypothetical protein [Streptomyces toyocaensis]KES08873.1 hypothetical protein BU52_02135 [Streptomyces toyocaensis]